MFKSLTNINTAFRQIKFFMIFFLVLVSVICIYVVWSANETMKKSREKIYVLDQGKSLILAISEDVNQNREAEAKDHVKRFHELFFTLSPDILAIEENIKRAYFLADKSVKVEYMNLKANNYYAKVIAAGIYQRIKVGEVQINIESYPYFVRTSAIQSIIRPKSIIDRELVTECRLINVPRTDNNPHGFLIENWRIIKNDNIQTRPR